MANQSTVSIQHTTALANPPPLGTTELRAFADEVFGVPYANPNYALDGYFNEQTKYVMSMPELLFGENRTNLGTQIISRQLMADEWLLTDFAPIVPVQWGESLEIQWDIIEFDPILPQALPEESRTRIGSWGYNSQRDILNRCVACSLLRRC